MMLLEAEPAWKETVQYKEYGQNCDQDRSQPGGDVVDRSINVIPHQFAIIYETQDWRTGLLEVRVR